MTIINPLKRLCPWCVILTGEQWVELQRVQLSLVHTAALEELGSESPAEQSKKNKNKTRYPPKAKSLEGLKQKQEKKKDTWTGRKTAGNVFRPPDSSSPCWRGCRTLWLDRPATPGASEQPGSPSAPPGAHPVGSELQQRVKNQLMKSFPGFILGSSTCLWLFKGVNMKMYVIDVDVARTFFAVCRFFLGFGIRRHIQFQDQRFHLWLHCHVTCTQRHLVVPGGIPESFCSSNTNYSAVPNYTI